MLTGTYMSDISHGVGLQRGLAGSLLLLSLTTVKHSLSAIQCLKAVRCRIDHLLELIIEECVSVHEILDVVK